jgi:DNA-binding response OmpR family regulator
MAKLLVVEDDAELCGMIEDWLTHEHYQVEATGNGRDALEKLTFYEFDLILLDWELPETSGLEICTVFRQRGGTTPILMLTGKKTIDDKELGLNSGADDYLTKPFHMKELSARVRAILRRSSNQLSNVLKAGDLSLDPISFRVMRGADEIQLQKREFALLEFFMRNQSRVFSPDALLERVWASESDATAEAIRTCLKRLRQKIDEPGKDSVIKTVHGVGYKLEAR